LAALVVAGSLALAPVVGAQTSGSGTTPGTGSGTGMGTGAGSGAPAAGTGTQPSTQTGTQPGSQMSGQQMTGTIKSIDDQKLVLEDGTEFMLPSSVQINRAEIREGAKVRVSYQEQGGQKVVTSVDQAS
jgi:hypothetical protein